MQLIMSLVGMAVLIGIAVLFSSNRRAIKLRTVGGAFLIQIVIGAFANETLNELTAEEVFLRRLAEESLDDKEKEQRLLVLFRQSYDALRAELEGNS